MTFTRTDNGNGTVTLTATYTAPIAKADAMLEAAAHQLFDEGYGNHGADGQRQWSAVTFNEKRALLDDAVKRDLVDKAKAYHLKQATETAYQQASTELGNFDL